MTQTLRTRLLCLLATVAMLLLGARDAHAGTWGNIRGTAKLFNVNGNYCPTAANCTGSTYPQATYGTYVPWSNAIVKVYDSAGVFLGQGSTATDGSYNVAWSSPSATAPSSVRLRFFTQHKDGRFSLMEANGAGYNVYTGLFGTGHNGYSPSDTYRGTTYAGSSGAPLGHPNAYWAAERLWRETLSRVGVLQTNFTGVTIRGFQDTISGFMPSNRADKCETSCAWGPTKQIHLNTAGAYAPQSRIMHEMGHIASYWLHPWFIEYDQATTLHYDWDNASPDGWNHTTAEWGLVGFEEALATHFGSVTFWAANAIAPTTCLASSSHCYFPSGAPIGSADLEHTSWPYDDPTNTCIRTPVGSEVVEERWPLSHMRFLWDVYDSHNDADGDTYSAANGCWWCQFGVLAYYGDGNYWHEINEAWVYFLGVPWAFAHGDARASTAYEVNYAQTFGHANELSLLRASNCGPP
jgi:hypothetical protein